MSTWTPIASQTLSADASSITFSSIPQNYTDLILVVVGQSTYTGDAGNGARLRFNGDTTTYYSNTNVRSGDSTPASYRNSSATYIQCGLLPSSGGSTPSGTLGIATIRITNYSMTGVYKNVLAQTTSTYAKQTEFSAGSYRPYAGQAITSITYFGDGNFKAGGTLNLYGVDSGAVATTPKATGGNIITSDGTYWYHAFTSSGTFTPATAITADLMVLAGGGAINPVAGSNWSGGGGAGGLVGLTSQSLSSATAYSVIVGAGGYITNGSPSQFGSLTQAVGGGAGAGGNGTNNPGNGGSGGGGTDSAAGGAGISGQGYAGGLGGSQGGGGGGGAGMVGYNCGSTYGGNGGDGVSTYSSWGLATGTGENISGTVWYGGGGGGLKYNSGNYQWGNGGKGNGTARNVRASALPTTGGGATNGWVADTYGGSGVVIVRYAV